MTHSPEKFLQNTSSMQHLSTAVRCVVEQLVYNYSMKSRSRSLLLHVTRCNFFCQRNGRCEVSHIVSAHASRVVFLRGVLRPCIAVVTQDPIQADNKRHRGEYVPRPCFVDAGTCTVCMSTFYIGTIACAQCFITQSCNQTKTTKFTPYRDRSLRTYKPRNVNEAIATVRIIVS